MKKITSVSNPTIVEFSKLSTSKVRLLTGLFMVEGVKSLEDIIDAEIEIRDIFILENFVNIDGLPQDKITIVSEPVMKKLSTSQSVPKVVTVAYQKQEELYEFKDLHSILLLDEISDPGNLGTLIRSAVAFGFEGILLYGNCVDLYNPKVIRSAAGNFFKIPIISVRKDDLKNFSDFNFIMTDLNSDEVSSPEKINTENKFILALGNEAKGLNNDLLEIQHKNVKIETKKVESLNVSVAGSIIMYEFSKHIKTF